MLAPFIYVDDEASKELVSLITLANLHEFGKAAKLAASIEKSKRYDDETKAAAARVIEAVDKRINECFTLLEVLSTKDPVLFTYYGQQFLSQLTTHERHKEMKDLLRSTASGKDYRMAMMAFTLFTKNFGNFFNCWLPPQFSS